MNIRAQVQSSAGQHHVSLQTNAQMQHITIPPKSTGSGSSVNGGELLFLALATCYCNDIYREAAKRGITVTHVEVEVAGEFGAEGEPASNVTYRTKVMADARADAIRDLVQHTDRVAEIQNTVCTGIPVTLSHIDVVPVWTSTAYVGKLDATLHVVRLHDAQSSMHVFASFHTPFYLSQTSSPTRRST